MRYKLSIITINLNNAIGLEKTCLSVAAQTFNDFEWIIIDGSSKDNSVNIIKQFSHKVTFWVSEPDSGIYNAMNKGIKKATGDYILFLNSGDFLLHPWTLYEAMNEIQKSKHADVYYSNALSNLFKLYNYPVKITLNFLTTDTINHQNCFIKRELFEHQLYNEEYSIISDWYFFISEFIKYNISFYHLETTIAIFDNNGISNNPEKRYSERENALLNLKIKKRRFYHSIPMKAIIKFFRFFLPYGIYMLLRPVLLRISN
jgi:glycosyltransferase involved in cell wall biosynthesis